MRKFKIYIILTLFFFLFFRPIRVHAASIALSAESLSTISQGLDSLSYGAYIPYGVTPVDKSNTLDAIRSVTGNYDITTTVTWDDFDTVTRFEDMPYDLWDVLNDWEFCSESGQLVLGQDLYYGHFDNGYFSGDVIYDSDGDIIYRYTDGDIGNRICNIEFGGSVLPKATFASAYNNASINAKLNGFVFSEDSSVNGFDTTFYLWYGNATLSGVKTESLFIANQYQPGQIIALNYQGWQGYICQWYANDLSYFTHTITGNMGSDYGVQEGDFVYDGIHYRYYVRFAENKNFGSTVNYDSWMSDPHGQACFSNIGRSYTTQYINYDTVSFNPADTLTDVGTITVERPYGLDETDSYVDGLSNTLGRDTTFDPSLPLSDTNYPYGMTIDTAIDTTLPIPLPDTVEEDTDVEIDYPLDGVITIPSGDFEIPIISDLQNRFPFSIPWDIKNLLKGLRARAVAPHFEASWYIRPLNYTWEFEIDLSMFDAQAEIFRTCFLISFIIGLAIFSYTHFFGT